MEFLGYLSNGTFLGEAHLNLESGFCEFEYIFPQVLFLF